MEEKFNASSQEEEEFYCIQNYHLQLLTETIYLLGGYHKFCDHQDEIVESAFARSLIFSLFGSLEVSCRLIAAGALFADAVKDDEDAEFEGYTVSSLSTAEKLFLRQEKQEISNKTFKPIENEKLISFNNTLIGYPTIYSHLFGIDLCIDKSCSEWQNLQKLKEIRDIGAHGKVSLLTSSPESVQVSFADVKRLIRCRIWYCKQLEHLPFILQLEMKEQISVFESMLEADVFKTKK